MSLTATHSGPVVNEPEVENSDEDENIRMEMVLEEIKSQYAFESETTQKWLESHPPKITEDLELKALTWVFKDRRHDSIFLVSGISIDQDGHTRSVQLCVTGFRPFCYVELPSNSPIPNGGGQVVDWENEMWQNKLIQHICSHATRKDKELNEYVPIRIVEWDVQKQYDLYGKIPKWYLLVECNTLADVRGLSYYMTKRQIIQKFHLGYTKIFEKNAFLVHEQNIDPIICLAYQRKLLLAGWIQVKAATLLAPQQQNQSDENPAFGQTYQCDYKSLFPLAYQDKVRFPKFLSFDFECDSENHNAKLPDPKNPKNAIRHIGIVLGRFGDAPETRRYLLLSLGKTMHCSRVEPLSKEGYFRKKDYRFLVENKCFSSEKDLILEFTAIIVKENPDVLVGFNIMKFDEGYLIARARYLGILDEILVSSRFFRYPAELSIMKWGSSAYGAQEAEYINHHGRVIVDVMVEVMRTYRLPSYSLDQVSEHFLKEKKEDVSPSQMFMIFRFYDFVEKQTKWKEIRSHLEDLFPTIKTFGFLAEYKAKMFKMESWKEFRKCSKELMTMVGYYCVIDCVLPLDLCDYLNLWLNMEQFTNIMGVPTSYLHTRGQQIKVLAQLYPLAKDEGFVIPYSKYDDDITLKRKNEDFLGAIVIEALKGKYKNVNLFDFESLYPSEIISNNICYTTYLDPDNPQHAAVPDSECNVLEWDQHRNCEHDPDRKKNKKKTPLCGHVKYRFRKIQYIQTLDGKIQTLHEGLMSKLERHLLSNRKVVKKELARSQALMAMHTGKATPTEISNWKEWGYKIIEKGSLSEEEAKALRVTIVMQDGKQLALKVGANSAYGGMGAKTGFIPFVIGAACVTASGRAHLMATRDFITSAHGDKTIYGDSVTGDTPVYISEDAIHANCVEIRELFDTPGTDPTDQKEYHIPSRSLRCWSDKNWTHIQSVMRHLTTKRIYRIVTDCGTVDVTEDHSILLQNGQIIKPSELQKGQKLLKKCTPHRLHFICSKLTTESARFLGLCFADESDKSSMLDWILENLGGQDVYSFTEGLFEGKTRIVCFEQIVAAKLCMILESWDRGWSQREYHLNYKERKKMWIITLEVRPKDNRVKKIIDLGITTDYVYDLTTDNHHFSAGVGQLVVHNTDSVMVTTNPNLTEQEKEEHPFDRAERISKSVTHHLKCKMLGLPEGTRPGDLSGLTKYKYDALPINLQRESRFSVMILLTKKRYMALLEDRTGKIVGKCKKGTVMVRRENCMYTRHVYESVEDQIFSDDSFQNVVDNIVQHTIKLVTRQIPQKNLVMYKAIGKFEKYAKKETGEDKNILSKMHDDDGQVIPGKVGPPSSSSDPLDWFYERPPGHVCLALKMLGRGDIVPPNTRMEYVFTRRVGEIPDHMPKQCFKIEDYTFYTENLDKLTLDYAYYVFRQIARPVSELLSLGFGDVNRYCPKVDTDEESMTNSFANLPVGIRLSLALKRGIKAKVLHFLNDYESLIQDEYLMVGTGKKRHLVLPDSILECKKLCLKWYQREYIDLYFSNMGIGKSDRTRRRNNKIHPLFMDLIQTIIRHARVVDQLERAFGKAFDVENVSEIPAEKTESRPKRRAKRKSTV
jgi:DNA polymerase elongation subunit (family B)